MSRKIGTEQKIEIMFDPADGLCSQLPWVDPEIFCPEGGAEKIRQQTQMAKEICSQCPVAEICLTQALHNREWGIWGGSTMKERKAMRKSSGQVVVHLRNLKRGVYHVPSTDENSILFY